MRIIVNLIVAFIVSLFLFAGIVLLLIGIHWADTFLPNTNSGIFMAGYGVLAVCFFLIALTIILVRALSQLNSQVRRLADYSETSEKLLRYLAEAERRRMGSNH